MWELDNKKDWVLKNWCLWTVVLEKTLESPWTARRSKKSILKENEPARTDWKDWCWSWSSNTLGTRCKEPTGKDWRQEEKGMTQDKVVGWHHQLNGDEFEQTPKDGEGQGSLVCCSSWDHKQKWLSRLNNNNKRWSTMAVTLSIFCLFCLFPAESLVSRRVFGN